MLQAFANEVRNRVIPSVRVWDDMLRRVAMAHDASFYRYVPQLIIQVQNEQEIQQILPLANKYKVPVTFRAAGTSLSGQAVTDSVLIKLGADLASFEILEDGKLIKAKPNIIAGQVNKKLLQLGRKLGPDPASIESCTIGGIASNNSSGMCCGTVNNSYNTIHNMRIVLSDGTLLDTGEPASRQQFLESHSTLCSELLQIRQQILSDQALSDLIRRKFAIKCTTGYSLNSFVDFDDPIEILKHLLIGSEGTLGFISEVTYRTIEHNAHRKTAFLLFPDIEVACHAASILRNGKVTEAAELMDRRSLRSAENRQHLEFVRRLDPHAAALLIETSAPNTTELSRRVDLIHRSIKDAALPILTPIEFIDDKQIVSAYWDARKGLIPLIGAQRDSGTTVVIEDVAVPVDRLAAVSAALVDAFDRYNYTDSVLCGHALDGNLHILFSQGFRSPAEVQRYAKIMDEICALVAHKFGGSLKAEHGTGRNMAPFVQLEWGDAAYSIMWRIKKLLDPAAVLNPGVVLNSDDKVHLRNIKPLPPANPIIDKCIECGFCESMCPSRNVTLTPRQRIVAFREMTRLRSLNDKIDQQNLKSMAGDYEYFGKATCAADGMCAEKCPVGIDTGRLIKSLRADEMRNSRVANRLAEFTADHFDSISRLARWSLAITDFTRRLIGVQLLNSIAGKAYNWSGKLLPRWNPAIPTSAEIRWKNTPTEVTTSNDNKVVYFPCCMSRIFGVQPDDRQTKGVVESTLSVLKKAGYEVVIPEKIDQLCCGCTYNSKGFPSLAERKMKELEEVLLKASQDGSFPILFDTSPCYLEVKRGLDPSSLVLKTLKEPVSFVDQHLLDRLQWNQTNDLVAIHVPCSSKKSKLSETFVRVTQKCTSNISMVDVGCCGIAGDRGLFYPELVESSLRSVTLPPECKCGVSTSRSCEISMSNKTGIHFRSVMNLIDKSTSSLN